MKGIGAESINDVFNEFRLRTSSPLEERVVSKISIIQKLRFGGITSEELDILAK